MYSIIADMVRVIVGVAAWLAGTALAIGVAWFGAGTVLSTAGASPSAPVVIAAPTTDYWAPSAPSPPPSPRTHPAPSAPAATRVPVPIPATARTPPGPAGPARTGSAQTSPARTGPTTRAGTARSYDMTGGRVTLDVTATSASLVSAVPDAGWAVQTWSGTDWLRVDFSSGSRVSSLIASWNGHPPSVTVTNG